MPFNLLLLPLLAGYLYLAKSNVRSYWVSQLQKEQLLLAAATYGLIFLIISRSVVLILLGSDAGLRLGEIFHRFAPFPYSGTSLGTVIMAFLAWNFSNLFVNERVAGFWLYHRKEFDPLTRVFWQSSIGVRPQSVQSGFWLTLSLAFRITVYWARGVMGWLLSPKKWLRHPSAPLRLFRSARASGLDFAQFATGITKPVMLNLKDSKVIVGLVVDLPANRPTAEFVTVLPLWTGYREASTRRLFKAVDYGDAIERAADALDLSRVIRTADIASAAIWSESAFSVPDAGLEDSSAVK